MSQLTTVFYPSDNEYGYLKATVRISDLSELLAMGWKMTQAEIHGEKAEAEKAEKLAAREYAPDPEKGDGAPGSREWHMNALAGLEDKDEIAAYAERCGHSIDKRGSVETVRQKALDAICGDG